MDNVLELPEGLLCSNEPMKLYETADGKAVEVRLLPSGKAEKWAVKAREVSQMDVQISYLGERNRKAIALLNGCKLDKSEQLEKQADAFTKEIREAQAAQWKKLKSALVSYDKEVFSEKVLAASTPIQLVGAFEKLRMYNDPFVVSSALQQEAIKATLKTMRSQNTEAVPSPQ